ncbi:helix-turn-helix domain-containing protein [Flavobacterium sp. GA093]|uniref:Helix-turn-helix domain-containing protein n=1 Tax=Flavobacterium hydrocarbonoxydans TaxID=2683249 RepID=A0A6I4NVE2_9FLAO|nr:helix-turn-helix domain-containing protein [Flavobacterium hydrocarbonoxydans]
MKSTNRIIVDFIRNEWVSRAKSQSSFAVEHNLDEKTVRSIKNDPNYNMSFETINKICEAKNLKLSEFFKLIGL